MDTSDWITTVIASLALIVSVTTALRDWRKDRLRIAVNFKVVASDVMQVAIVNTGYRPVYLTSVALASDPKRSPIETLSLEYLAVPDASGEQRGRNYVAEVPDHPLEPGQQIVYDVAAEMLRTPPAQGLHWIQVASS
jgi:hypothetical protein